MKQSCKEGGNLGICGIWKCAATVGHFFMRTLMTWVWFSDQKIFRYGSKFGHKPFQTKKKKSLDMGQYLAKSTWHKPLQMDLSLLQFKFSLIGHFYYFNPDFKENYQKTQWNPYMGIRLEVGAAHLYPNQISVKP